MMEPGNKRSTQDHLSDPPATGTLVVVYVSLALTLLALAGVLCTSDALTAVFFALTTFVLLVEFGAEAINCVLAGPRRRMWRRDALQIGLTIIPVAVLVLLKRLT